MIISKHFVEEFRREHVGFPIISLPDTDPCEIICEHFRAPDHSYGVAVALIGSSKPHFHQRTRELYIMRRGAMVLRTRDLAGGPINIHPMNGAHATHEIPLGVVHWVESTGPEPAEVLVITWPAWTPEDHHLFTGTLD